MGDRLRELTDQIQAGNSGMNRAAAFSQAYREVIAEQDRRHRLLMDELERQGR